MRRYSAARKVLLVMRPHRVLHTTVGISSVLHSYIPIPVSRMRCRSRRSCERLWMRTNPTLILLVREACWRLRLRIAVVFSRAVRLAWWGIAVVSSRRTGGVRVWLLPLIHSESACAKAALGTGRTASPARLLGAKLRSTRVALAEGRFRSTSESRTRRNGKGSLVAEADAARGDPVACQRCMVG